MAISRKATEPVGITNTSGQPEIVLEIDGMTISMAPPAREVAAEPKSAETGDGPTDDAER